MPPPPAPRRKEDPMKKPKRYPIALNLPRVVALLIVYGRHVVQSMKNSTWFPGPRWPTPTPTSTSRPRGRVGQVPGKGAVEMRDLAEKVVVDDMIAYKGYVGQVVAKNI